MHDPPPLSLLATPPYPSSMPCAYPHNPYSSIHQSTHIYPSPHTSLDHDSATIIQCPMQSPRTRP
ncbi:hypothetical protein JB92DRAFT_3011685 [Gautieria morchelliformis]|nr:hypothetical protein JB92DRAFT_3011685 [Gautieria morchelliformis]